LRLAEEQNAGKKGEWFYAAKSEQKRIQIDVGGLGQEKVHKKG